MKKILALMLFFMCALRASAGSVTINNYYSGGPLTGRFYCWATQVPFTTGAYSWMGPLPITLNPGTNVWPTVEHFYMATVGTGSPWVMYTGYGLTAFQFYPTSGCMGFNGQLSHSIDFYCGMAIGGDFKVTTAYDPLSGNMTITIMD